MYGSTNEARRIVRVREQKDDTRDQKSSRILQNKERTSEEGILIECMTRW